MGNHAIANDMNWNQWTEEDLKLLAKHLRKPEGEIGEEVALRMNQGNAAMNLHTLAVLNPQANQHILEIGMGNGMFVQNILNLYESIKYTGLDYSADMVKQALRINERFISSGRAVFSEGNIEQPPFENDSFNQIFTVNTLYFWKDIESGLRSLKKLLKPSGRLIISIRPKDNMQELPVTRYNFNLFDREEILELLNLVGFVNIELTEIKEPPQINMVMSSNRKCLIFCAEKA